MYCTYVYKLPKISVKILFVRTLKARERFQQRTKLCEAKPSQMPSESDESSVSLWDETRCKMGLTYNLSPFSWHNFKSSDCTGWHIMLIKTFHWHQNKGSVFAWPGQIRPGQNGTFVLKSTGGLAQADVSPCMEARREEWRQQAQMAVHKGYEEGEGTSWGWHIPSQMQLYIAGKTYPPAGYI